MTTKPAEQAEQIEIEVESEPHNEDLSTVVLNRPAPNGGAFLISTRLARNVWEKAKAAGAYYYSADDLEDFDMFNAPAGWRYPIESLRELIRAGLHLVVRDEVATTIEQLDAMFTPEACAAYHERQRIAEEAAKRAEAERKAEAAAAAARKEAEFTAWKAQHINHLVRTYSSLPATGEPLERVHFNCAGTWYTTGNTYTRYEIAGQTVWCLDYGNATCWYAPQAMIDEAVKASFQRDVERYGAARAARYVLDKVTNYADCIGGDVAVRLVELHGEKYFVDLAATEEWRIANMNSPQYKVRTAERFGLPHVQMTPEAGNFKNYTDPRDGSRWEYDSYYETWKQL